MVSHLRICHLFSVFVALALVASAVHASAPVHRCESDGRITYGDVGCTDGSALVLPDNRGVLNPAQQQAGSSRTASQPLRQTADQQARRAAQLTEKRRKEEIRRQQADDKRKLKCAQLAQRKKWAEEDLQAATLKNIENARRKMQRATGLYLTQCRP